MYVCFNVCFFLRELLLGSTRIYLHIIFSHTVQLYSVSVSNTPMSLTSRHLLLTLPSVGVSSDGWENLKVGQSVLVGALYVTSMCTHRNKLLSITLN